MANDRKIWVIDSNEGPELTSLGDPLQETPRPSAQPQPRRPQPRPRPAVRPARPTTTPRPQPGRGLHSAILLALAYALGPLGGGLTGRGRRSGLLTGLTTAWALAAAGLGAGWWLVASGRAPGTLVPLLALATGAALLLGFGVWTRSLHLLLTSQGFPTRPWPAWMKNPWVSAALGLVAPGSAYALSGRPGRTLAAVWSFWPAVTAVTLLALAPLVWSQRAAFAAWGLGSDGLERFLVVLAAVAVTAPLLWVGQALLGARMVAARQRRWLTVHGDRYALALVAVLGAFVLTVPPEHLAAGCAHQSQEFAAQGMHVVPVGLAELAARLEPGRPDHLLQVADLHARRGDDESAAATRQRLDEAMRPYLGALIQEGSWQPARGPDGPTRAGTALLAGGAEPASVAGAASSEPATASASMLYLPGLASATERAGPPAPHDADAAPDSLP